MLVRILDHRQNNHLNVGVELSRKAVKDIQNRKTVIMNIE